MDGFMDCKVTTIREAALRLGRARQWHVTLAPGNMEDWKHKMSGILFDRKADMCVRVCVNSKPRHKMVLCDYHLFLSSRRLW